jgi:peptidoglycan-associated lipoprotein
VSQEDFAAELAAVRQEMRAGDQAAETAATQAANQRMQAGEQRMEARIAALERGLESLGDQFQVAVERFESAIRFNTPVHFAFDETTIREADYPLLDRFAEVVRENYAGALITVEGFADPVGSAEYNKQLGQGRAEAVKTYLQDSGLPADRMRAVSYGEAEERQVVPGASGPGDSGWENRRVALVVDFSSVVGIPAAPPVSEGGDP